MTISSPEMIQSAIADISKQIFEYLAGMGLMREENERVIQCLKTTLSGGKLLRGRTVVDTAWILSDHTLSTAQIYDLQLLGCLIELFHAAYLIWDDIMDESFTRRGQPCWHRRQDIGMTAINDGCLIKSCIQLILKTHFRDHPAYLDILNIFDEAALQTEVGQHCDNMARIKRLEQFSWNQYEFITAKKTAFYTLYLPLALPLLYLDRANPEILKELHNISMLMGLIFQARDDFLDVYGDPKITGKVGTDIQDKKCSWLSVQAMMRCNEEQKRALVDSYGSKYPADVARAKAIFDEVNLPNLFRDWDTERLASLEIMVDKMTSGRVKQAVQSLILKYFQDLRQHLP